MDDREFIGKVSEAELEYSYRYADHLQLGDDKPDPTGFDPDRIAAIQRIIDGCWARHLRTIRQS